MSSYSAPRSLRSDSAWSWLALAALMALTTACPSIVGGGPSALMLTDLSTKTLPITIEGDENNNDVRYRPRSVYRGLNNNFSKKKDVRLLLRAKKDGAALRAVLDQEIRTNAMDYRIRIAFDPDKTIGLIDGTSLGFFDFVLTDVTLAEGGNSLRRLEAIYNASTGGYTVHATNGRDSLGIELDVPNEEVVLRLRLAGGTLFMEAGTPIGHHPININTTELYSESFGTKEPIAHTFAWGVSGLGKAGRLYFAELVLWGSLPDIGSAETPILMQLASAIAIVDNSVFPTDVASATEAMEAASALLIPVIADLAAAVDGGQFKAATEGERALKNVQKALTFSEKAKSSGEKLLAAGKTNPKSLSKKARVIRGRLILALAQMVGFRSNSTTKVNKSGLIF